MDEIEFTLNGKRYRLTREMVTKAMRRQVPGRIQTYSVDVEGVEFPVKQVLAQALGIPVGDFISTRAQDLLSKLGFVVTDHEATQGREAVSVDRASFADRAVALGLAVRYVSARDQGGDENDVLRVAGLFQSWLVASRRDSPET